MNNQRINIYLDKNLKERIQERAKIGDHTISTYIREVLKEQVIREEMNDRRMGTLK